MALTNKSTAPALTQPKGIKEQIPRNALGLLLAAQFVVVLPHSANLSPWLMAVVLFCGLWRIQVYRGRFGFPARTVKGLMVAGMIVAVAISGAGAFSLEAAASLLVLAFALKLIEMRTRRDAYLVIFLAYFVVGTVFLFDQSMLTALIGIVAILVTTAAMVGMNQQHYRVRPLASLRISGMLLLQALPLTVILFLCFPRIAPLWTVPVPGGGFTGLSDKMTPGDIANLTQSDEVAFRVVFKEKVPQPKDLYWRGLVYTQFESGTWSIPDTSGPPTVVKKLAGDAVEYEVLLEPTATRWLFGLDVARPGGYGMIRVGPDYRLEARDPVLSVFRYPVRSYLQSVRDYPGSTANRLRDLAIDPADNPRIQAFALDLAEKVDSVSEFAQKIARTIQLEPFVYTLQPARLQGANSVDQFWFGSRRGFCTHYAGALVLMARAAGIPARVVGGYQGGMVNPITGHLVVRQYDAHAWAELWDPNQGWLRFDPTAAVAPDRIEKGLDAALSEEDRQRFSTFMAARFAQGGLINRALNWADSVEHRWNLWVVGFDEGRQRAFLKQWLGELSPTRIGLAMLLAGGICLGIVALILFWRRRPPRRAPAERLFLKLCKQAQGLGIGRRASESPRAFLERLGHERKLDPKTISSLIERLDGFLYNPDKTTQAADLATLRSDFRRLRYRLALSLKPS